MNLTDINSLIHKKGDGFIIKQALKTINSFNRFVRNKVKTE